MTGLRAARWSLANQMDNLSYQNVCTAYGILMIARATHDMDLVKGNLKYAGLYSDSTGSVSGNIFKNNQIADTSGGYYELGLALRAPGYTDAARAAITAS